MTNSTIPARTDITEVTADLSIVSDQSKLDYYINELKCLEESAKELRNRKKMYEAELMNLLSSEIDKQLADKDYNCGTANIETVQHRVKVIINKKVSWDQEKLSDAFDLIEKSGENPREYIKVKYDVSENAYKSWPSKISRHFEPARTVMSSSPQITFEVKGNEQR